MNNTKTKKIFCLMGYSGVGKDAIAKEVINNMEDDVKFLVSTTTRPMRPGEKEGREYYFITKEEFFKMKENDEFIESREYHTIVKDENGNSNNDTWYYGLSKQEVDKTEYGLFIVDAGGFNELKMVYGRNTVVPIYIQGIESELRERAVQRGDCMEEFDRRLVDDIEKFMDFRVKIVYDIIRNYNGKFEESVKEVCQLIRRHMKDSE